MLKERTPMLLRKEFVAQLLPLIAVCCVLLNSCEPRKPAGPPEQVTIAIAKNLNSVLVKIADTEGFFREEGIDVTLQTHSFGKTALQSLLDGKADLATAADTPIMFATMKGAMLSILATIDTSTRDEAIVANKDRGIGAAADLKGLRIGVALHSSGDYFLDSYLILNALSRQDVTIVDMNPEKMAEALVQGQVDAVSISQPHVANLRRILGEQGLILYEDSINTKTFNIVSMRTLTRQRPEAIRRLLRALVKAENFIAVNHLETQRIIAEFTGMDGELLASIWNDFHYNLSLNQSLLVTLENQARWAIKNGLTDRDVLPDFLEVLSLDGLRSVKPDSVRVIE
jgi:ABC-type nitrate/sulfonate/bicarbonate transport system substrate-binding protein